MHVGHFCDGQNLLSIAFGDDVDGRVVRKSCIT
jgi:hypothetical protein